MRFTIEDNVVCPDCGTCNEPISIICTGKWCLAVRYVCRCCRTEVTKYVNTDGYREIEEMAAMMAQQMLQGMMEQQQAQQQGPPGQGPPQQMMGPQGIEGVEGGAWNPAMGMPPPAMASPEGNTREAQTGLTRAGGPVAELP